MTQDTDQVTDAGDEVLAVPLAELRPALEAILMVADQPLDDVGLAAVVGYPAEEVRTALHELAGEYDEQGRGFELRNVAGGWRYYTREQFATGGGELRAGGPAGSSDPGGARDPGGGGLPAAGLTRAGVGGPRGQRRRRDAHAADARAGRGGRSRRRARRHALPHDVVLPGADRGHLDRRPPRAGALPPGDGGPRRRAGRDGLVRPRARPGPPAEPAAETDRGEPS